MGARPKHDHSKVKVGKQIFDDDLVLRREHSCALLSGGRVIVAGGKSLYGEDIISTEVDIC